MEIGKAIYKILNDNIAVESMVGTRIAPNVMKQTSPFPFIIYDVATDTPEGQKDSVALLDTATIVVSAYSKTYAEASKLANYIRTALDRVNGVYNSVNIQAIDFDGYNDVFDDMSGSDGIYRKSLNFNVRIINSFNNIYSTNFDGVDDYVALGVSGMSSIKNTGSFSLWFKMDAVTAGRDLIYYKVDAENYIRISYYHAATELRCTYGAAGSTYVTATDFTSGDGSWYHVAGTWDKDANLSLYLNGDLKQTTTIESNITGSLTEGNIGKTFSTASYFKGNIDEVSVYNSTLSQSEVTSLYNNGLPFNPEPLANLKGYWKMGDGGIVGDPIATFPTIPDVTGNNDGTMTNMTSTDFQADVPE